MALTVRQNFPRSSKAVRQCSRPFTSVAIAGIFAWFLTHTPHAYAQGVPLAPKDIGFKVGLATGTITVQENIPATVTKQQTTESTTYQTGGVAMLVSWHETIGAWLDSDYAAKVLVDRANNQMLSYGGEASVHVHLLGGARRFTQGADNILVKSFFDQNLSLLAKVGAHQYSSEIRGASFKGAAVELRAGFEYRKDMTRNVALGGEVTTTVTSIAMGSPTLTPRMNEFLLFARYAP